MEDTGIVLNRREFSALVVISWLSGAAAWIAIPLAITDFVWPGLPVPIGHAMGFIGFALIMLPVVRVWQRRKTGEYWAVTRWALMITAVAGVGMSIEGLLRALM